MFKIFYRISLLFLILGPVLSYAAQKRDDIRIVQLLPNLSDPLAIDPALPPDFVAGSINQKPDVVDGVIWGNAHDLEKLHDNSDKIESTFILARLSSNVLQSGPDEFNGEKEFTKELQEMNYKDVTIEKFKWGKYPVLSLQAKDPDGRGVYVAWAGLNADSHLVMLFNFLYPEDQKSPNDKQLKVWQTFLTQTKELPEKEFQMVYGIDMQEDFTLYTFDQAQVKAYAEKRNKDKEVLVVIESLTENTKFHIKNVIETKLGTKWNYGKPCVKISGELTFNEGKSSTIANVVITVLLKDVEDFNKTLTDLKDTKDKHAAVYEGKPSIE